MLALDGCGGSDNVVQIRGAADASISRAMLDHWMQAMAGADFRTSIGAEGPRGLVSEPADYSRCFEAAKLVAPRSFFNQLRPSARKLDQSCHALYRSVKAQSLGFLISAEWTIAEGAEHGIALSHADVERAFEQLRKRDYPTEQRLHDYLAERHWSLSDLFYQLKVNLLAARLTPRIAPHLASTGSDGQAYAQLVRQRQRRFLARTTCRPGYVVPGCREYRGSTSAEPAPDQILKKLVHVWQ